MLCALTLTRLRLGFVVELGAVTPTEQFSCARLIAPSGGRYGLIHQGPSPLSLDKWLAVEHRFGQQARQLYILVFERQQTLGLGRRHAARFRLPGMERGTADPAGSR